MFFFFGSNGHLIVLEARTFDESVLSLKPLNFLYDLQCSYPTTSEWMEIVYNCYLHFRVVINADGPHIKMVSEQFDRCHGTLLQYVEFLYSAVTPATAYAQLIPSLDDLIHKYHLDPEV